MFSQPNLLLQIQQLTNQLAVSQNMNRLSVAGGLVGPLGYSSGLTSGAMLGGSGALLHPVGSVLSGPGAKCDLPQYQLPNLTFEQRNKLDAAKKYAMDMSIKTALMKQNSQLQQQQSVNVKRAQALVLLSRIYVGSINYDVREESLRGPFLQFGPIKNVSLSYDPLTNKHKGFCFVEYELPESAQLALEQMNGVPMCGRAMKVGRPSNMPNATQMQEELINECKLQNRIFIASVHEDLTEDDLKTVFEAFGKINFCRLEPDPSNPLRHRGFGFIEYETVQSATDAVTSMNMFDLGGQLLRVGPAITPPNHVSALGPSGGNISVSQMINADMPGGGLPIPQAAAVAAASITAHVLSQEAAKVTQSRLAAASSPGSNIVPPPAVVIPKLSEKAKSAVAAAQSPKPSKVAVVSPKKKDVESATASAGWSEVHEEETGPSGAELNSLEHQENFEIRGRDARGILMQKLQRRNEQKVLILRNMVGPEEIDDTLEDEVAGECGKFGKVEQVVIYQEKIEDDTCDSQDSAENVLVKIFVRFDTEQAVLDAVQSLNGRYFGGRIVVAERYDQHLFDAKDLTQ